MLLWWAAGRRVGGLPWDYTHTHSHTPSLLISLIRYDMWLAATSILQICTLAGSGTAPFREWFHPRLYFSDPHRVGCVDVSHFSFFLHKLKKKFPLTYSRVLSHIFEPHMWPCDTTSYRTSLACSFCMCVHAYNHTCVCTVHAACVHVCLSVTL